MRGSTHSLHHSHACSRSITTARPNSSVHHTHTNKRAQRTVLLATPKDASPDDEDQKTLPAAALNPLAQDLLSYDTTTDNQPTSSTSAPSVHEEAASSAHPEQQPTTASTEQPDPPSEPPKDPPPVATRVLALTETEETELMRNLQSYRSFTVGKTDLLVGETSDGKLSLKNCFVCEKGAYARPIMLGKIPKGAKKMITIPWVERDSGDPSKFKPPVNKVLRMYFAEMKDTQPFPTLNYSMVYLYDGDSRSMSAIKPTVLGKLKEPVLRIQADGSVTVEDRRTIIAIPDLVNDIDIKEIPEGKFKSPVAALAASTDEEEVIEEEVEMGMDEDEEEPQFGDEMDEMPDIPAVDMM